jgi:hypothetical protein
MSSRATRAINPARRCAGGAWELTGRPVKAGRQRVPVRKALRLLRL